MNKEKFVPDEDDLEENGYARDENGELIDEDGEEVYCEACEARAVECVKVSADELHDDTRCYCSSCLDVYYVGVQHGRFHEAARHGDKPGRDSSQDMPKAKKKRT